MQTQVRPDETATAEPDRTAEEPRRRVIAAGTLLCVAGIGMLMGFITGEALYPRTFTTSENTISDLGGTVPPDSVMLQPSRGIFIATVLAAGAMILVADVLLVRAGTRRGFSIALALFGIGVVGVGVFPGNVAGWHPLFAMLAFVAGGVAAIMSRKLLMGPMRAIAVTLGTIALFAIVFGSDALIDWGPGAALGVGGMERWIAYPVIFWMVAFGSALTGEAAARDRAPGPCEPHERPPPPIARRTGPRDARPVGPVAQ
ncbi:MAG: DUF998 domain-containing protein [Actinomycetota bacterium]